MSFLDFAPLGALFTFGPLVVPAAWIFVAWAFKAELDSIRRRKADADEKEALS